MTKQQFVFQCLEFCSIDGCPLREDSWIARRKNQSILKEISPEYSLQGWMLKLMRRAASFEKTPMLGKIEAGGEGDDRGGDGWMASPTQWT